MLNKLNAQIKSVFAKKIHLSSDIVGAKLNPFHFDVTFRQTSNYAASIVDNNRIYYDTVKKNNIVAHPLFPVRISWQIIENINQYWEIDFPEKALENLVHQSEYLEIHRLVRPGDELTVQGELAALVPHKFGAKLTLKFDYFDSENELVQTEIVGGLLFGAKCTDYGKSSIDLPNIERIEETNPIWEEQIQITRAAPFIYDGCNNIVYPIHTDIHFAQNMGLPDIILQGTATLARSASVLVKKELNNDPRLIKVISGKFTDILIPPNQISVQLLKRNDSELYFCVLDKNSKYLVKGGYLKFRQI